MTDPRNPEKRLITRTTAISMCRSADEQLPDRTFDRLLAKGAAPAPVERRGGVPLWDCSEILSWVRKNLPDLLIEQADEVIQRSTRNTKLINASQWATTASTDELPTHLKIQQRLIELEHSIGREQANRERLARLVREGRETKTPLPQNNEGNWWLRRLSSKRGDKIPTPTLSERLADVDNSIRQAEKEAAECRLWLDHLFEWAAEARKKRQQEALRISVLGAECRDRRNTLKDIQNFKSAEEFLEEDSRRLAWRQPDGQPVLNGSDFGYDWRADGTEDTYARSWTGTWRVSWINGTGELYAWCRATDEVLLFGTFKGSFDDILEWISPLISRQKERNSLALLWLAFNEQREAGFPALEARRL